MTTEIPVEDRLEKAIILREQGRDIEARAVLLDLYDEHPDHSRINLQCAWIHDELGLETEAVAFYERAITAGLSGEDLHDALLGLGSTYRALGRYDEALDTLTRGTTLFPDDTGLQVFRALALYNKGRAKEACERLLEVVARATADPAISRYRNALLEYSADLDRTWT